MKNIKIRFDPYAYVRIAVMRTLLLKKSDYDKMLKMEFSGIAKFLQETTYKREIDELGIKYKGARLIEHALNKNLMNNIEKIKRIADENLKKLLDAYLLRVDFFNLKTIVRGKTTGISKEEIKELVFPIGILTGTQIDQLLEKNEVADILKLSKLLEDDALKTVTEQYNKTKDVVQLENELDKHYFKRTLEFADKIGGEGAIFKQFLKNEIDLANIFNLMKFKQIGMPSEEVTKYFVGKGNVIDEKKFEKLAAAKDLKLMIGRLKGTEYHDILNKLLEESKESMIFVESGLTRHLLKKSVTLMHKNLLTIDVILAYIFSKEIEIKNLKMLTKAKQLSIEPAIIERELVI